jgi:hypothetical protein
MFSHLPRFLRKNIIEKALHHKTAIWLSRMDAAYSYQTNFILIFNGGVSYGQHGNIYAWKRGAEFLLCHNRLLINIVVPKQL